ncbi:hypothetical protein Cadr_000017304 [Camelus dromedarius]|uniref:Uncharacterized protein n=1 Tax=Camelus dromedarius TaxID=9838 RepID=A0A5N4DG15_CAMDR|nr:hypothetical protein Cadr_000017304 [Camelus dromedarius]
MPRRLPELISTVNRFDEQDLSSSFTIAFGCLLQKTIVTSMIGHITCTVLYPRVLQHDLHVRDLVQQCIYPDELIYCLVLLLLTAVLYRIYHGFLTAEKGTVEFSHTKDCAGNRLLLLNVP